MATQPWVRELLQRHRVPFQEIPHKRTYTAQQLAEAEHISGHRVAKVVAVITNGRCVQTVLPASRSIDLPALRETLGTDDVRLANEDELSVYFGNSELGAMPPLRHSQEMEVWMDESLATDGDIVFQGGTHDDAIRMRFADWERVVRPRVAAFSNIGPYRARTSYTDDIGFEEEYGDWEY